MRLKAPILIASIVFSCQVTVQQTCRGEIPVPAGVQVIRDVAYVSDGHERQRLDLYLPQNAPRPMPVVVWVHGGGWKGGTKDRTPALPLTEAGFAVVAINYRLSQHAIFPAQIHDCKAAVRWLRAHATDYHLDPNHIGAWGSSAGGHLVALMGTTNGLQALEGEGGNAEHSSDVQAVVDWFGPTDFFTVGPKDTRTELLGGEPNSVPEQARLASPMHHVSRSAVPMLVMHGDADKTVPLAQSESFVDALKKSGANATFVKIEGAGHGGKGFTNEANMLRITNFFRQHLGLESPR